MKILQKILALQCAAATVFCSVPLTAAAQVLTATQDEATIGASNPAAYAAQADETGDGYRILYRDAIGLGRVVYGLEGEVENLTIPAKIDGLPVSFIRGGSFGNLDCLRTVKIEEGIKTFSSVSLFSDCKNLESAYLPDSFQLSVGDNGIFSNCISLSEVRFPRCAIIPSTTFIGCSSLREFVIPSSIVEIHEEAFRDSGLINIYIPDGVTGLGKGVFAGCTDLKEVTLGRGMRTITENMFASCTALEDVEIPSNINWIQDAAFRNCLALKSITIPNTVETVGDCVFMKSGLTEVTIEPGVQMLGSGMFAECDSLKTVSIPGSVSVVPFALFQNCDNLESVILEDGVEKIESDAFPCKLDPWLGKTNFTKIQIPASVTEMDDRAFGMQGYRSKNLTIYGYTGSYAEEYAAAHNIKFVSIGNVDNPPAEPEEPEEPEQPDEEVDDLAITKRFPEAGTHYVDSFRTHDITITFNQAVGNVLGTGKIEIHRVKTGKVVASYACDAGMTLETERIRYQDASHKTVVLKGALDDLSYDEEYYITIGEKTFTFDDGIHMGVRWLPALQDESWKFILREKGEYPEENESWGEDDGDSDGDSESDSTIDGSSKPENYPELNAIRKRVNSGKKLLNEYNEATYHFNVPNISGKGAIEAYKLALMEYLKVTDPAAIQYAGTHRQEFKNRTDHASSLKSVLKEMLGEIDGGDILSDAISKMEEMDSITQKSVIYTMVEDVYVNYKAVGDQFADLKRLLSLSNQTEQSRYYLYEACDQAKEELQNKILNSFRDRVTQLGLKKLESTLASLLPADLKVVYYGAKRVVENTLSNFDMSKNQKAGAGLMHLLENLELCEDYVGNRAVEKKNDANIALYKQLFEEKRSVLMALYNVAIRDRELRNQVSGFKKDTYMGDLLENRDKLAALTYKRYVK